MPDLSPTGAANALRSYRNALSRAVHANEFLNRDLAVCMITGLEQAWIEAPALSALHRGWLVAATAYLVDLDDRNQDFTDLDGLDDDALIVASALRALGHATRADDIEGLIE